MSRAVTFACCAIVARASSAVNARSQSPVRLARSLIAFVRIGILATTHWTPGASRIWPSVSEALNPWPASAGPLQRDVLRAHRYTQAAASLSGSRLSGLVLKKCQPQDQTDLIF